MSDFLHGVEVVEVASGPRPISTVRSSVIGLVGIAPDAEAAASAAILTGDVDSNTGLTWTANTAGQGGNSIAVYRHVPAATGSALTVSVSGTTITVSLETGDTVGTSISTAAEVLAAVNAHTSAAALVTVTATGASTGVGIVTGSVRHESLSGGADAALPLNTPVLLTQRTQAARCGLTGTIPEALNAIWDQGGAWVVVVRVAEGVDSAATKTNVLGSSTLNTGLYALTIAQSVAHVTPRILIIPGYTSDQAVLSALVGVAERLRSIIVADGPNSTDAAAVTYREHFGSDRVYLFDPKVKYWDSLTNAEATQVASPRVAGVIAQSDRERGFWCSPSNRAINGITGTARGVSFALNDPLSSANYLNENGVATIIHQDGYRTWGNRSCAADPKWTFLCVRRTADMIHESLIHAHLWAVDRGITRTYYSDVAQGVNDYLAHLRMIGAIAGDSGRCWVDPALNTADQIAQGHAYFDFDFTPVYPAERVTFRSHLVNDYLADILPLTT